MKSLSLPLATLDSEMSSKRIMGLIYIYIFFFYEKKI